MLRTTAAAGPRRPTDRTSTPPTLSGRRQGGGQHHGTVLSGSVHGPWKLERTKTLRPMAGGENAPLEWAGVEGKCFAQDTAQQTSKKHWQSSPVTAVQLVILTMQVNTKSNTEEIDGNGKLITLLLPPLLPVSGFAHWKVGGSLRNGTSVICTPACAARGQVTPSLEPPSAMFDALATYSHQTQEWRPTMRWWRACVNAQRSTLGEQPLTTV